VKEPTQPGSLAGRYKIAQIFGVSRQGTQSIIDHPDFPAPIDKEGKNESPIFWTRDVESFKAERDRTGAPAAA
jgi:hypothetical protein